jgi:hypothetical protein
LVEVVKNSLWTVAACGMMMFVIAFPVYHSYTMGGITLGEVKETVQAEIETKSLELLTGNIDIEL